MADNKSKRQLSRVSSNHRTKLMLFLQRKPVLREHYASAEDRDNDVEVRRSPTAAEIAFDFVFSSLLSKAMSAFRDLDKHESTMEAAWIVFLHFQPLFFQWLSTVRWMCLYDAAGHGFVLVLFLIMSGIALSLLAFPPCATGYHSGCLLGHEEGCVERDLKACGVEFATLVYLRCISAIAYIASATFALTDHKHWYIESRVSFRMSLFFATTHFVMAALYLISSVLSLQNHTVGVALGSLFILFELVWWFLQPWFFSNYVCPGTQLPGLHEGYLNARFGRFVSLALATLVSSVLINENGSFSEPTHTYMLIVLCPFFLMSLLIVYFDIANTRARHAIKVSDFRGCLWMACHGPLVTALFLLSSSFVTYQESTLDHTEWPSRRQFGGSIVGFLFGCYFLYHLHLGRGKSVACVRLRYRIFARIIAMGTITAMTFIEQIPDMQFVLLTFLIVILLGTFETIARIPADAFFESRDRIASVFR